MVHPAAQPSQITCTRLAQSIIGLRMKRILVLTELYFPEQTSTGYFLTKTAEGLAEEYEVKVVTGPATNLLLPCEDFPKHERRNQVEIWRCGGTNFNQDFLVGRFLNLLSRSLSIFRKALVFCQRNDTILVVTNPPVLPFVALLLKWIKGSQFVLLIHDVYPEALVAVGLCSSSSPLVKVGQLANRILYKQASKIITLGRDMTELAELKLPKNGNSQIICIPNWADNELIKPLKKKRNPLLQKLGIADKFIVLYAGNIGRTHGIEYVAEAARMFREEASIYFIVSGFGAKKKWLTEYIATHQLNNISILAPCASDELVFVLNACDVAVISFLPGMAGVSVPSRMYNQMAAGKPIIAVADQWSELAQVVQEEEIGWLVKPGDVDKLVSTIKFAASDAQTCATKGAKAAAVAQTKYTFAQSDNAYKKVFREIS